MDLKILNPEHQELDKKVIEEYKKGELKFLIEYLNSKFFSYPTMRTEGENPHHWTLTSYNYFGMTYGIDLVYQPKNSNPFMFRTLTDSGYNQGFVINETADINYIYRFVEGFPPTNPDFKTDRK